MENNLQVQLALPPLGVHGHVAYELREFDSRTRTTVDALHRKLEKIKAASQASSAAWDAALRDDFDGTLQLEGNRLQQLARKERRNQRRVPTISDRNSVVVESGDWDNLILDSGLDQLASQSTTSVFTYCAVGTGNTAPATTQQGLVSESARTGNYLTSGGGCGTAQPNNYTWVHKRTFDFPLAALNGTYAEVGFSFASTAGANLYNRSLIQSSGVPTAVTVTLSQQLRVVFTHTVTVGPLTITRNVPEINGWTVVTSSGAVTASQAGSTVTSSASIFAGGMVNHAIKFANGTRAIITAFTNGTTVTVDRVQTVTAQSFSLLSGTTGADQLQLLGGLIGGVGGTGNNFSAGVLEPSNGSLPGFVSASSTALPSTAGTGVDRSGVANTNGSYSAQTYLGGFKRDYKMSFGVNDANQVIRSFGLSNNYSVSANSGTLVTLLDADQSKTSFYTLDLVAVLEWTRA